MLNRSRIIRRVLIVVSVLLVSGAAAAMKLTSWTPANMCFCPTPDHPDSAVKSESGAEAILPAGSLRVPLDTNTTAHSSSGALGSAPLVELAEKSSNGNANAVGKPSWAPWGKNANRRSASASSGSGPSASLGSLWKMMSFSSRAHNTEQQTVSARVTTTSPAPRAAKPKPSPAPKPSKPSLPSPSTPPSAAVSPAPIPSVVEVGTVAMAGSAFREDATPVADLVAAPLPIPALKGNLGASLGHGNAANVHAGAASNLAATPEPGSFALIATGLLGIAGLLRRKRV